MFKTTAIDTLKQDKKCQACWYMILSTMSGSTTTRLGIDGKLRDDGTRPTVTVMKSGLTIETLLLLDIINIK